MNKIKTALFHQSGRSMIEMLGVLAIIGVLSVGGLAGYNMAMHKIRINKVVEEMQLMMATLDSFNPGSGTKVTGLDYTKYIDVSSLKAALNVVGASFNALVSGYDNRYTYVISFKNASEELCLELITKLDDGTDSITLNTLNGGYQNSALLNSSAARQICKKQDIEFFFGSTASNTKKR